MKFKLVENFNIPNDIPTDDEIRSNKSMFMRLPIHYVPNAHFEGRNMTDYIEISDKFFDLSQENKRHVLIHEVAHNITDELLHDDWDGCSEDGLFVTHKIAPKGSVRGDSDFPDYWEGLFGDVGGNSLSETITDAIVYYYENPEYLKKRGIDAYSYLDKNLSKYV